MIDIFCTAAIIASICTIWVKDLTHVEGLFGFVPKYYPYEETFTGKLLRCHICLSGWAALIYSALFHPLLLVLPCVFLAMAMARIIGKN